jgi:xanthine dehydrogenase small subunit
MDITERRALEVVRPAPRRSSGRSTQDEPRTMRDYLTFVLNGEVQRVSGISPTTTLLQWLRRHKRLIGTKEGCAEGDCGACTVVVGSLSGAQVRYEAINACIAFLPMLEGKSVTTVEAVAGADGKLHPVQQALVECHSSQCGFCTSGFVMSLLALYRSRTHAPLAHEIDDALAGNLCRCTGYGPIATAAQRMFELPRPQGEAELLVREGKLLKSIQHDDLIEVSGDGRRMLLPVNEDELAELYLAHPDATLIAGATDVGLWVTKQDRPLPLMILLGRVREFGRSHVHEGMTRLGAAVTHADAADTFVVSAPALAELWRRFAGRQVRNAGTVTGNIANGSPIGDLAPALIALDAGVNLRRGAERRVVPLDDFFLAYGKQDRRPGEYISSVDVPDNADAMLGLQIYKISKRFDDDISALCVAFNLRIEGGVVAGARIAFGGMAAIPKRGKAIETALIGKPWTRASIDAALPAFAIDFAPISDSRASATYRLQVAQNLLIRAFIERAAPEVQTRLVGVGALVARDAS